MHKLFLLWLINLQSVIDGLIVFLGGSLPLKQNETKENPTSQTATLLPSWYKFKPPVETTHGTLYYIPGSTTRSVRFHRPAPVWVWEDGVIALVWSTRGWRPAYWHPVFNGYWETETEAFDFINKHEAIRIEGIPS